jgi:hypothetical protein
MSASCLSTASVTAAAVARWPIPLPKLSGSSGSLLLQLLPLSAIRFVVTEASAGGFAVISTLTSFEGSLGAASSAASSAAAFFSNRQVMEMPEYFVKLQSDDVEDKHSLWSSAEKRRPCVAVLAPFPISFFFLKIPILD